MRNSLSIVGLSITMITMAILATLLMSPPTSAAEKSSYQSTGTGAYASWDECIENEGLTTCTYTSIYAAEQVFREGKSKNGFSVLCISQYSYSFSEDGYNDLLNRWGCTEDATVSVSKKLTTADASGIVTLIECFPPEEPDGYYECADVGALAVDASWTGTGKLSKSMSKYRSQYDNFKVRYHDKSSFRAGEASAIVGGVDLGQSPYSYIYESKSSSFSLCQKDCW
jgi:hypothetical protein